MYNTEILYPYIITKEEIVCTWEWPIIEEYLQAKGEEAWIALVKEQLARHENCALAQWKAEHLDTSH